MDKLIVEMILILMFVVHTLFVGTIVGHMILHKVLNFNVLLNSSFCLFAYFVVFSSNADIYSGFSFFALFLFSIAFKGMRQYATDNNLFKRTAFNIYKLKY
jgi:hypothetical protein